MIVDLWMVYSFIRRLATPFKEWEAYKLGIIDENGNVLRKRKTLRLKKERDAFGVFDVLVLNLKKLLEKVPGGQSRLASYAAALYLIREWNHFSADSLLTEDITDEQLSESIDLFYDRYVNYIQLPENVKDLITEVAKNPKPPRWKRAGPNGELEIKFPTGRRFKVEKQFDENERHRGEWKVMEYKTGGWVDDWEWIDTYKPKGFAKQKAMQLGQYDKKGKKVADYSSTFQYESVQEAATNPHTLKLIDKIKRSGVVKSGSMSKQVNTKPELEEEPVNNVGSGNIAGLGVGPQGEPGLTPAQMKRYKKKNKGPKRLRDVVGKMV